MKNNTKQFVIQQHTTPNGVHWDLMLEMDDTLWTWRLNVPPAEIGDNPIPAERIHNHPMRFLTYQGPVQNNTGTVKIAEKGTYTQSVIPSGVSSVVRRTKEKTEEPIKTASQSDSLSLPKISSKSLIFDLHGTVLAGCFTLFKAQNMLWRFQRQANP